MRTMTHRTMSALALALFACSNDPAGVPPVTVASVEVMPAAGTLAVGDTMRVVARPKNASGEVLGGLLTQWAVSNDAVASVSTHGVVTAKSAGTARITAAVAGKSGNMQITVVGAPQVVDRIEIHALPPEMEVGQQIRIEAILKAADGTVIGGRAVTWQSTNDPAATVVPEAGGSFAMVTAHALGGATIIARAEGRMASVQVWIRAVPPQVGSVVPSPANRSLWVGEAFVFTATVLGPTGEPVPNAPPVTWSVTDPTVATVDVNGRVKALKVGATTVRAQSGGVAGMAWLRVVAAPEEAVTYELNTALDPHGDWRAPIVIGTTHWYEDGVVYAATLLVAGGTFEMLPMTAGATWEQTFRVETWVQYPTGITRKVATDPIVDRGTWAVSDVGIDDGRTRYTFTSTAAAGRQFTGEQSTVARLVLHQSIGSAPSTGYLYEFH